MHKQACVFYAIVCLMVAKNIHASEQTSHKITTNEQDRILDTPKLNRLPPPYIENITIGDTSYYLDNIKDQEVNASTTYLLAIDEDYEELWRVAIYQTRFNKDIETDVQEVFPTKLDYNRDNHSFVIENENGDIFTFDLTTFVVMELQ